MCFPIRQLAAEQANPLKRPAISRPSIEETYDEVINCIAVSPEARKYLEELRQYTVKDSIFANRVVLREKLPGSFPPTTEDPTKVLPAVMPYRHALPTGWPKGYVNATNGSAVPFSRPWPCTEVCRSASDVKYYIPQVGVPISLDTEMVELRFYNGPNPMEDGQGRLYKVKGTAMKVAGSVAIVDLFGRKCYEAYVRPEFQPVNYQTQYSGLTRHLLKNAINFRDMQAQVSQILAYRDVIGSAVLGDLEALLLDDIPGCQIVELQGNSHVSKALEKEGCTGRKLADMSRVILKREIQDASKPHSALEDALAGVQVARTVIPHYKELYDQYIAAAKVPIVDGEYPR